MMIMDLDDYTTTLMFDNVFITENVFVQFDLPKVDNTYHIVATIKKSQETIHFDNRRKSEIHEYRLGMTKQILFINKHWKYS